MSDFPIIVKDFSPLLPSSASPGMALSSGKCTPQRKPALPVPEARAQRQSVIS